MSHSYAVILAGGSGERFWPLSTNERPKQFVSIFEGKPLIRHAVDRLEGLIPPERVLIITAENLVEASKEACPTIPSENIIGEPCRRDTAAASALACGLVAARDPDGIAVILTADQLVKDTARFRQIIKDSVTVAACGRAIITVGITPDHPATGFGYIESGEKIDTATETAIYKAKRFVEKPNLETAEQYLKAGTFFWNSGMFIWSVKTMAAAVRQFTPELEQLLTLPAQARNKEELIKLLAETYPSLKKISVDFAIMEKYDEILVAPGAFGWDDVGAWPSIAKHFEKDECGNVALGNATLLDCKDSIVLSDDNHITAVLGLEDVIVVHTPKATLVCPKSKAQEIKKLLAAMK